MERCAKRKNTRNKRRGAVVVLLAVTIPVIVAFAALTVDVGVMYNAKSDLQRAADSAAMAAAARLADFSQGDPITLARATAKSYVTRNQVLGRTVSVEDSDITFGRASVDMSTGQYTFTPTNVLPDSVRVVVRKTTGSANGPLPLFFAHVMGFADADVQAEAIAVLVPRDIAVTADLSGSHSYDSRLRNYKKTDINLYEVWSGFPGGIDDVDSTWGVDPDTLEPSAAAQMTGPAWGYFKQLGFGTTTIDSSYDPQTDPGLVYLPDGSDWNNSALRQNLLDLGYSGDEVDAIMSADFDVNGAHTNRTAVALGLAEWYSGIPGGLWEARGISALDAGNGNGFVGGGEIQYVETFGDRSLSESSSIWENYIVRNRGSSNISSANSKLRDRYGVKTFIDYLMNYQDSNNETPEFANTPQQPMQAVKDAVGHLADLLDSLDAVDRMSLEVYGTTARHEVNLTTDYSEVVNRLTEMQAAHYDSSTNMGAGMMSAITELTSDRANPVGKKVMLVLTDGYANAYTTSYGSIESGSTQARQSVLDTAQLAADQGIQIIAVSVGSESDSALMQEIADIGDGHHFHAEGTIDQYSDQLDAIFKKIGGIRPVELIR